MRSTQPAAFRHIAIEGPIGVGKSSLARKLGTHLGAELLMEQAEENPYLERFYADRPGHAFQAQVFFLFQRLEQVKGLAQPGIFSTRPVVSDFMFAKDALFARMNLGDDEYRLYLQMHTRMAHEVPEPSLVVWLQAPTPALMRRIERRGIAMERHIDEGYLQRLSDAYAAYFQGYQAAPVVVVDTEDFNPVEREADFAALCERLGRIDAPRTRLGGALP